MSQKKNIIFGLSGIEISHEERAFFQRHQPLGFILFSRNIGDPEQVRELVQDLRSTVSHKAIPILIDQEGGRVRRLKPPHYREAKAAGEFAALSDKNLTDAKTATFLNHFLMGRELSDLGINVDCAPVVDLLFEGAHSIIGDRSFGKDPHIVTLLGRCAMAGLMAAGVLPILKHIPGHGRAMADSHQDLPVISTPLLELEQTDFIPFKKLASCPLAMTAHVIVPDLDPVNPVTVSKKAIDYIREGIGYENIIITDDLSMKALSGTLGQRAEKSQAAGCDLLLHCNGKLDEMEEIAQHAQLIENPVYEKLANWLNKCYSPEDLDANLTQYVNMESQDLEVLLAKLLNN